MADVQSLIDFYRNLLIIQYNSKPKARATIELFASTFLANGIFFDVLNAYNLDTAVGHQLDIIGKYVGVDRYYDALDLIDYFACTSYTEVSPDASQKYGFCTYSTFDDPSANGTLNYQSIVSVSNKLSDDDFRTLIRLKILQNTSNHSHKSIDDAMFKYFGLNVLVSSDLDMTMTYTVVGSISEVMKAAIYKNVLPKPIGVELNLVIPE